MLLVKLEENAFAAVGNGGNLYLFSYQLHFFKYRNCCEESDFNLSYFFLAPCYTYCKVTKMQEKGVIFKCC